MSFEQNLQKWVTVDNQLKLLNEKMKELREQKSELSDQINEHIESHDLTNKTFQLSDGHLKFGKSKETQPLTFKYLETCLGEIIKNEEQVKKIVEYVKNKRESKEVPEIKRFYKN